MVIYLSRFAYIEIAPTRGAAYEMLGFVCRLASSAAVWQNHHWAHVMATVAIAGWYRGRTITAMRCSRMMLSI